MTDFGHFYLDKEKDIIVDLYMEGDALSYVLRTPNHATGNLITNLARLCGLSISFDADGLKVVRGKIPTEGVYSGDRQDSDEPDQELWTWHLADSGQDLYSQGL